MRRTLASPSACGYTCTLALAVGAASPVMALLGGRSGGRIHAGRGHPDAPKNTIERAAFLTAWSAKTLRGVCMCSVGTHGNAATRMEQFVPSEGQYAYGGWPNVDALWKQQARETDKKKREALLQRIQQIAFDRVRFAGIWDYVWPSGVGPRVAEPAFLLIDPYPLSAPYEELRLKK